MKKSRTKYIHPFPARMAPEIAIKVIKNLKPGNIVLDPMAGSGTVLHHAALNLCIPVGFDLDPLAVLITKVATQKINIQRVSRLYDKIIAEAKNTKLGEIYLPWIDDDYETSDFIKYWFARKQINSLRKISYVLHKYKLKHKPLIDIDVLRLALSRIIITKKIGASLAWDISHSRPHKMRDKNDYDVFAGYESSVATLLKCLEEQTSIKKNGKIRLSDARKLKTIPNNYADAIITSPPYLNAIDYMRGHKFSLVWLGHSIPKLRKIRSTAVGVEKKISSKHKEQYIDDIYSIILKKDSLSDKQKSMIKRYIHDSIQLMSEISRILKRKKKATLVVGNSTLNGSYIKNSQIFSKAGKLCGLRLVHTRKRDIPLSKRYLPIPKKKSNSLSKRMKHEMVMTFVKQKAA